MIERKAVFILLQKPSWLDTSYLDRYLPDGRVISYAAFRCPILLAPNDLATKLCRQVRCYPDEVRDSIRRVIKDFTERFEAKRHIDVDELRRLFRELSGRVDRAIERYEPSVCVGIEALGCYLRSAPYMEHEDLRDLIGKPLIVINVDKISDVVDEALNKVGDLRSYHSSESIKRDLLKSVITHEVTHSYTDIAHEGSPKRRLEAYRLDFYYRVIEESLATYYELITFIPSGDLIHKYIANKLLQESSIEYVAGLVWYFKPYLPRYDVDDIINSWIGLKSPLSLGVRIEPLLIELRILDEIIDYLWRRYSVPRYPLNYLIRHYGELLTAALSTGYPESLWKLIAITLVLSSPSKPFVFR